MWLWATSTVPRRWDGTPSATQAVPSNIPSPRPISTKPLSSSPWAKRAASASRPRLSPPGTTCGSCGAITWSSPTAGPTTARRRTTTSTSPSPTSKTFPTRWPGCGSSTRTSCGWTTTTAAPGPPRRPTPLPEPRAKRPSSILRPFTKPRTASLSPTNRRRSANRSSRTTGSSTNQEASATATVGLRAFCRQDRSGPRLDSLRRALPRLRRHRRGQDHPLRRHHLRPLRPFQRRRPGRGQAPQQVRRARHSHLRGAGI